MTVKTRNLQSRCAKANLLATTAFFTFSCLAHASEFEQRWSSWIELGGYGGSDDSTRAETTIFHPFLQTDTSLFFADLRGKFFVEDAQEGNFAFGYRQMLQSGWNAGVWAGLDVRNSQNDNTFYQAAMGLELLSDRFDGRFNGYVPLNTDPKAATTTATVALSGNSIFMFGGQEIPLYGIDGEVGAKLIGLNDSSTANRLHELRLYAGGFWFDSDDAAQEVAGPKARLEYRVANLVSALPGSRLTLEGEYSYDDVRESKWEVGAKFRIPIGGSTQSRTSKFISLSAQERRMTEGLERDTDIVTGATGRENVQDAITNVNFDQVLQTDVSITPNLGVAASNAGSNTLIIVDGSAGDYNSNHSMTANQTWQGGGSSINVRGLKSGIVAQFTAPGSRPTINNNSLTTLNFTDFNHLSGFNVNATSTTTNWSAVGDISGGSNSALTNNTISTLAANASGLLMGSGSNVLISGNTFNIAGDARALSFSSNNLTGVKIDKNVINTPNGEGIFIGTSNSEFSITNNHFAQGADSFALSVSADTATVAVSNNRFAGAFSDDLIRLEGVNGSDITLSGSSNIVSGTIAGDFCQVSGIGTMIGSIGFDGGLGTCPP